MGTGKLQVKIKGLGIVGYVANSPFTVKGESMSAGRLYDRIGNVKKARIEGFNLIFSG